MPPAAKFAVFFRNVNLGQLNNPSRTQFESAFTAAGGMDASSFITTGNIVFPASSEAGARKVLLRAREILKSERGLEEPAFLRSLHYLAELVKTDPFTSMLSDDVYDYSITFMDTKGLDRLNMPLESTRGDLTIFRCTSGEAFSVSRMVNGRAGHAGPFLEKLLGVPATTRVWNTVLRLVRKHV
jgi:uncharacterized protein (DUF1697 family)